MEINIKERTQRAKDYVNDLIDRFKRSKVGCYIYNFFKKGDRKFVLLLYGIAILVFLMTLFSNYLAIVISGDFKLQEVPFYYNGYDDWWKSLLSGQFVMWDDSGFLGQNNIGTNTFYYLWNIFFLPTLLFPRVLVPQALAFIIITKFVLAGFVMKKLLSYMGISSKTAKIVSIAYAFSGWSFYYLWFNHFLEIAVLFPWVLLGIEKVLKEKKIGHLVMSLFVSAITNYFFFIMFCFCGVIYALFRYFQMWKDNNGKDRAIKIALGVLSFAVAIVMAAVILIPAFKVAMESSRAQTSSGSYLSNLTNALKNVFEAIKGNTEKGTFGEAIKEFFDIIFKFSGSDAKKHTMYPLVSYFFPPVGCFDSPLFANNGYDNTNCSLFMYTPLTLLLIPSLIKSFKEKKVSHLIGFVGAIVMIFSPFFYYCFTGFTTVCYGRWQLFIVAIACIYIAFNIDEIKKMKGWYFDISVVACLALEIVLIILSLKFQGTMGSKNLLTSTSVDERLYVALIQPIYLVVVYIIIRQNFMKKSFFETLKTLLIFEAVFVGNMVVIGQGTVSMDTLYGGLNDVGSSTKLIADINKNDDSYFRIFNTSADRDSNNLGMVEGYRGLGTFHSMYNYELDEFAEWSRITYTTSSKSWRPWSMGVHEKRANLDTFLGVKYYIVNANDSRLTSNSKLLSISNGKWSVNENSASLNAYSSSLVDYNSGEYVISSISLKEQKGEMDVFTVEFVTNTSNSDDVKKTYNITISSKEAIKVSIGANGNWFFNDLDIGVKGCPNSLSNSTYSTIKSIQKMESEKNNIIYNIVMTNGETLKPVVFKGEDTNVPFGYEEIARDEYNVVYENKNFVNFGFAFDTLHSNLPLTASDSYYDATYSGKVMLNEAAYVRTAILDPEDILEIKDTYTDANFEYYLDQNYSIYRTNNIRNSIDVINVSNSDIQVYLQNWDHKNGVATSFSEPQNYPSNFKNIYWNSYMDVDLSSYNVASEAKLRGGAFVTVNARMGENLFITLYGEDEYGNEYELARDIHMKHAYDKSGDWKFERGFYVNDQVTRIRVRAYDTFKENQKFAKPNITVTYYDDYKANIDKLNQNKIENLKIRTNSFTFDTNYTDTKMEVLTIPYDEGWSLYRFDDKGNKTQIKLYKAQGGFNSFVAEKGDFSYSLEYVTPGLKTGILGFGIGFTLFSIMYIGLDLNQRYKEYMKKIIEI